MASTPKNAPDASEAIESTDVDQDASLAKLNSALIPMCHPDGGTCDSYKSDKAGNILVPALEAATMIDHGFVVADQSTSDVKD